MPEIETTTSEVILPSEPKIVVEYRPGRWGKTFHLFDGDNQEISLHQKDAVRLAKHILQIAKGRE